MVGAPLQADASHVQAMIWRVMSTAAVAEAAQHIAGFVQSHDLIIIA